MFWKKLTAEIEDITSNILQGKEKNVRKPSALRKNIARVKTILNEKESTNA